MKVKVISTTLPLIPISEMHYSYCTKINDIIYPQVHDFYEFYFVIQGSLHIIVNDSEFLLDKNSIFLVRPGDIHTKKTATDCVHLNIAFLEETLEALFSYLHSEKELKLLHKMPYVSPITLSKTKSKMLARECSKLSILSHQNKRKASVYLRQVLTFFVGELLESISSQSENISPTAALPPWFRDAILLLEDSRVLPDGMEFLKEKTGKSKEHIYRTFRKHLNTTPSQYINALRLNHVAEMLIYTEREILDLAFETGFQSSSHFYELFKKLFHTSPKKFREKAANPSL